MAEQFDPNSTIIKKLTSKKSMTWMTVLGGIGAVGGALVALNAFTGLNLRPAWGYEVENLLAADSEIKLQIDEATDTSVRAAQAIVELTRGQLHLKVDQITAEQRELRRELARSKASADDYKKEQGSVPEWLTDTISDTQHQLRELEGKKEQARRRLLDLTR